MINGFKTEDAAFRANRVSGYRLQAVDLAAPFGGRAVGTGYALLARGSHAVDAVFGSYDVRLSLPDRDIDDHDEAARLLGLL